MSGQITYNYAAMDQAYEEMLRAKNTIDNEIDRLSTDAQRVLQPMGGSTVDGYNAKLTLINTEIDSLNAILEKARIELQQQFDDMGQTDRKLGDGF